MQQFKPSEIAVKTVGHEVLIEAIHEERDDGHGPVMRHFRRKYVLPKEYDMNDVSSFISLDGVLTIKAPPPPAPEEEERDVPVKSVDEKK